MRNLSLGPTLSTEVRSLPVPSLGLPGGQNHIPVLQGCSRAAEAEIFAHGKWSSFSAVLTAKS